MKTMNRQFTFLTYLGRLKVMLALLPLWGLAPAAAAATLSIQDGYVRGLPPGVHNTAAYMTIVNHGGEDMVLTGGSSTIAKSASLHATEEKNGQISMQPVQSAVVPAHGKLVLESGGLHLMLMGLHRPLRSGDSVRITLQFENSERVSVDLPVISVLDE